MKGYKVFDANLQCHGFQYEVGKVYHHTGSLKVCDSGFHFCLKAVDCFNYYDFNPKNRVCEVVAKGKVLTEGDKSVTDEIEIVRELSWGEVLELVNTGKGNTGKSNSGDRNSGDWNSGYWNSGYWNSGYWNSGYRNSGYWNSGDWNSGDFNKSNFNSGCFNTEEHKIKLFDKDSEWTYRDWLNSEARDLLSYVEPLKWIESPEMTEEEKKAHPEHETTGGYLKQDKNAYVNWWNGLSNEQKEIIKAIPNFDADKFEQITGIKV